MNASPILAHFPAAVDAFAISLYWVFPDAKNISLYFQTTYSENDSDSDLINFYVDDIKLTDSMGNTGSTDIPDTPQNPGTTDGPVSSGSIMAEAKENFTSSVPADMKTGDTGKLTKIQYFSKKAQKNK